MSWKRLPGIVFFVKRVKAYSLLAVEYAGMPHTDEEVFCAVPGGLAFPRLTEIAALRKRTPRYGVTVIPAVLLAPL